MGDLSPTLGKVGEVEVGPDTGCRVSSGILVVWLYLAAWGVCVLTPLSQPLGEGCSALC